MSSKNLAIEMCKSTLYKSPTYQLVITDGETGYRLLGPKLAGSYSVLATIDLEGVQGERARQQIRYYLEAADKRQLAAESTGEAA
jgi:hypothetical protein